MAISFHPPLLRSYREGGTAPSSYIGGAEIGQASDASRGSSTPGLLPYAKTQLRHPAIKPRHGYSHGSGVVGPQECRHHPDIYPRTGERFRGCPKPAGIGATARQSGTLPLGQPAFLDGPAAVFCGNPCIPCVAICCGLDETMLGDPYRGCKRPALTLPNGTEEGFSDTRAAA
jgi:hypothetical protein